MAKDGLSSVNSVLLWNRMYTLDSFENIHSEQPLGIQSFRFEIARTWIIELMEKD